jgi:hypothetical protein
LRFASRRVDRSRNEELFGLRVRGERMRDAGILPGGIVIVRRLPGVEDGAIVVALVDEEATIKRLRRRAPGVRCGEKPTCARYTLLSRRTGRPQATLPTAVTLTRRREASIDADGEEVRCVESPA